MSDQKENILVIEDDASMRLLVSHFLGKTYEVHTEATAESAMSWLEDNNTPELIITDMILPGMQGVEFIECVKSSDKLQHIPILVLSSLTNPKEELNHKHLSIDGFIRKPFNPEELRWKIQSLIAKQN